MRCYLDRNVILVCVSAAVILICVSKYQRMKNNMGAYCALTKLIADGFIKIGYPTDTMDEAGMYTQFAEMSDVNKWLDMLREHYK